MGRGSVKRLPRRDGGQLHGRQVDKAKRPGAIAGARSVAGREHRSRLCIAACRPRLRAPLAYALVPCAGVGARAGAGGPKQYAPLAGRAWWRTRWPRWRACRACSAHAGGAGARRRAVRARAEFAGARGWVARCGGATRAADGGQRPGRRWRERGARADDWVLVHDAARCLVRAGSGSTRLIDACLDDAVGGLLALPLADTLKQASATAASRRTLDRARQVGGADAADVPPRRCCARRWRRPATRVTDEASADRGAGPCAAAGAGRARELQGHLAGRLRAGRTRC